MATVQERLIHVFQTAFGLPPEADVTGLRYRGIAGWDSVAHMALVAAIEKEFDILMETEQILDLSGFAEARDILKAHGHAD